MVAHCLEDVDIPLFLSMYYCIKAKATDKEDKTCVFLDYPAPFCNPALRDLFGNEKICKTPAWALAHCLEQLQTNGKRYLLYPCEGLTELGKAADHAYIIIGTLNKHKRYTKKRKKTRMLLMDLISMF